MLAYNDTPKLLKDTFPSYGLKLKRLEWYETATLEKICDPYLYKPKPEATNIDMHGNSRDASFIPVLYNGELYLAIYYKKDKLPSWLDTSEEGRLPISRDILKDCRYYDFGYPSFFNTRMYFASRLNVKTFWNCGIADTSCQIKIGDETISGTISNITLETFTVTLDVMSEFNKSFELSKDKRDEVCFIEKRQLSPFALELAKTELKKLYIDYRFFFMDYKEEIKEFFRNYLEQYKEELAQIEKDRRLSKKLILRDLREGKTSEEEANVLLEKRKAAGDRKNFIMETNLAQKLMEYSRENWGRRLNYQKYHGIINDHLLSE